MKGFIELNKIDNKAVWLRATAIVGVSEHRLGSLVHVQGQAAGFEVQGFPGTVLKCIEQAKAE